MVINEVSPPELAHRRKRLGYSQQAFAEMLGKAGYTANKIVSRWETGATPIPKWMPLVLYALENGFDWSYDAVHGRED